MVPIAAPNQQLEAQIVVDDAHGRQAMIAYQVKNLDSDQCRAQLENAEYRCLLAEDRLREFALQLHQ